MGYFERKRLNPCCNGIGEIGTVLGALYSGTCLNPCCNGIGEIGKKIRIFDAVGRS